MEHNDSARTCSDRIGVVRTGVPGIAYPDIYANMGVCRNQAAGIAFGVCRKAMSTENTGADFAVKISRRKT